MAERNEVVPIQAQGHPHLLHLVDKALQGPQAGLVRLVAVMGAELVVVDDLEPGVGQRGTQGLEVLVGRRRAAVQEEDAGLGIVPEGVGPDFELARGVVMGMRRSVIVPSLVIVRDAAIHHGQGHGDLVQRRRRDLEGIRAQSDDVGALPHL